MDPYRRIVSYLYKYNRGQKEENTGYIRVEKRKEGIRIHLHIKDLRMLEEQRLQIYFYIHREEKMDLIYVDELLCVRGICEYKSQVDPDFAGAEFDDINGVIFLAGERLIYGSCWDEREILEESLFSGNSKSEKDSETDFAEKNPSVGEDNTGEEVVVKPEMDLMEGTERGREEEFSILHTSEMEENSMPTDFFASFPEMHLSGSQNLIRAAQIQMDDLSRLAHEDWKLADNAFLKQAYEREGHLMVGRIQMPNHTTVWVLGVPGSYDNREKYLAGIFGFSDYIPQKESEYKTGGKGYWIRPIAPIE